MPYIIDWPRKSMIALVAACLPLVGFASPALAASTTCSTPGTAAVFSPFGDSSLYIPVPGGSFENNTTQKWTLTKESIATGNEPWYVNSTKDTQSLNLDPYAK